MKKLILMMSLLGCGNVSMPDPDANLQPDASDPEPDAAPIDPECPDTGWAFVFVDHWEFRGPVDTGMEVEDFSVVVNSSDTSFQYTGVTMSWTSSGTLLAGLEYFPDSGTVEPGVARGTLDPVLVTVLADVLKEPVQMGTNLMTLAASLKDQGQTRTFMLTVQFDGLPGTARGSVQVDSVPAADQLAVPLSAARVCATLE